VLPGDYISAPLLADRQAYKPDKQITEISVPHSNDTHDRPSNYMKWKSLQTVTIDVSATAESTADSIQTNANMKHNRGSYVIADCCHLSRAHFKVISFTLT
jgi:hypothetical protein